MWPAPALNHLSTRCACWYDVCFPEGSWKTDIPAHRYLILREMTKQVDSSCETVQRQTWYIRESLSYKWLGTGRPIDIANQAGLHKETTTKRHLTLTKAVPILLHPPSSWFHDQPDWHKKLMRMDEDKSRNNLNLCVNSCKRSQIFFYIMRVLCTLHSS